MDSSTPSVAEMPSAIGTALTYMVTQIGEVLTIVTANPVLCLGLAMWCAGGAIGLFKRLV